MMISQFDDACVMCSFGQMGLLQQAVFSHEIRIVCSVCSVCNQSINVVYRPGYALCPLRHLML